MINASQFAKIFPKVPERIKGEVHAWLNNVMSENEMNTLNRQSMFLAQIDHESMGLTHWEENLNYSEERLLQVFPKYFPPGVSAAAYARNPEKLANRVYANRMGNGNEASGDGWRFRGRGPLGLTGRNNYLEFSEAKYNGTILLEKPEWVAQPEGGMKSAGWYWSKHNLNALADEGAFMDITKRINGGLIGFKDRVLRLEQIQQVL